MATFTPGTFTSPVDGLELATYTWDEVAEPRGVVQVAHGLAEHSARYERLARALVEAGYAVVAADHRGHGRSISGTPGDFGEAGFEGLITDVAAYGAHVRREGVPLLLVAHSMGSFAVQGVLLDHSDQYDAVVLSGSTALDVLAQAIASQGGDAPAGLEAFNAGFEHRTGYEWLSRDDAEVDLYVADPLCGFEVPEDDIPQMFAMAGRFADAGNLSRIRDDLPVLIASGEKDPLSGDGQLVQLLGQRYRDAGLTDVTVTVYPQARHEILNETNRDEVTTDLVRWLVDHTPTAG